MTPNDRAPKLGKYESFYSRVWRRATKLFGVPDDRINPKGFNIIAAELKLHDRLDAIGERVTTLVAENKLYEDALRKIAFGLTDDQVFECITIALTALDSKKVRRER